MLDNWETETFQNPMQDFALYAHMAFHTLDSKKQEKEETRAALLKIYVLSVSLMCASCQKDLHFVPHSMSFDVCNWKKCNYTIWLTYILYVFHVSWCFSSIICGVFVHLHWLIFAKSLIFLVWNQFLSHLSVIISDCLHIFWFDTPDIILWPLIL